MKVHLEVEVEIDGKIPKDLALGELLAHRLAGIGTILSEETDGTEDWAIIVRSVTVEGESSSPVFFQIFGRT